MNEKIKKRIEEKMQRVTKARPLSGGQVKKLKQQMRLDMIYHSNAIEGNTMTLQETHMVLEQGLTIKGKTFREHLEVKNHASAIDYLYDIVNQKISIPLSEKMIRDIHSLVVRAEDEASPGQYRDIEVRITGSAHIPPPAYQLDTEMHTLVQTYRDLQSDRHIIEHVARLHHDFVSTHPFIDGQVIEHAARLHHDFVSIHPFIDGNGRTGRVLMNVMLMQHGYPLVVINKNNRFKYYNALESVRKNNSYEGVVEFVAQAVENALDNYLSFLEPTTIDNQLVPLKKLAKYVNFDSEYLGLLARQGKLEAVKRERLWYSSREAVQRYLDSRERIRGKNKK